MIVLSVGQDAQIVHELARGNSIHCLDVDHIAIALVMLESLHQVLGLWASNAQTSCLINHDLFVPSIGDGVMIWFGLTKTL